MGHILGAIHRPRQLHKRNLKRSRQHVRGWDDYCDCIGADCPSSNRNKGKRHCCKTVLHGSWFAQTAHSLGDAAAVLGYVRNHATLFQVEGLYADYELLHSATTLMLKPDAPPPSPPPSPPHTFLPHLPLPPGNRRKIPPTPPFMVFLRSATPTYRFTSAPTSTSKRHMIRCPLKRSKRIAGCTEQQCRGQTTTWG